MEPDVVPCLRVEIQCTGVRVAIGAEQETNARQPAQEIDESWRAVQREDGRGLPQKLVVAHAPALFVPRNIVAMDLGPHLLHVGEKPPHDRRRRSGRRR